MIFGALRILFSGWISWAILGTVVATGWFFVNDYQNRGERIAVLEDREKGWKKAVQAANLSVAQAKDTLAAADKARETFKVDVEQTCAVWNEVKESNTPVLDLLEKLKQAEDKKRK